jgi:type III pantothenate kinase
MKVEMGEDTKVIATGGHAALIADVARSVQHVNEDLGLEGLRLLYERRA